MPHQLERVEPGIYYCLYTGEMNNALYMQLAEERAKLVQSHDDDPHVFIIETKDLFMRDWDMRVVRAGAEIEPISLLYIVVSDFLLVQMTVSVVKLFVKVEGQPNREKAIERARAVLQKKRAEMVKSPV